MSLNPIFKFIDNKSARQYEIYEDGQVKFKENHLWQSYTDQIGLVINNIPKRFNEIRNDEKILAEASRRFKECAETEKQITREEAVRILEKKVNVHYDKLNCNTFIDGLEALGLIKFKEEENKQDSSILDYLDKECTIQLIQNGTNIRITGVLKGIIKNNI